MTYGIQREGSCQYNLLQVYLLGGVVLSPPYTELSCSLRFLLIQLSSIMLLDKVRGDDPRSFTDELGEAKEVIRTIFQVTDHSNDIL